MVIVAYRPQLTPLEELSARQCLDVLGRHPVFVVAPEGLSLPPLLAGLQDVRFPAHHFTGITAYSALMLSQDFYRPFRDFRYMLIHQLDVFVFRDELLDWCARGYDYIGAPWLDETWPNEPDIRQGLPFWTRSRLFRWLPPLDHRVGNGGFSLRKVDTMHRALGWLRRTRRAWGGRNEDGFWSIALPECWWPWYRVPPVSEALAFAFETTPSLCYERNGRRLPFGCHAWERFEPEFWHPHLAAAGRPFDLDAVQRMERRIRHSERKRMAERAHA